MNKYFANLQPMERRLVVGVGVMVLIALNWLFIWPEFSDWSNYKARLDKASLTLEKYHQTLAGVPQLQQKLEAYKNEGEFVESQDQSVNFMRTIQQQSTLSGVQLQNAARSTTSTNDLFFAEQVQNINVLATEDQLVDFLYKLGTNSAMIRVRDLSLQPDPPRQKLIADIRLVASYQKTPTASAAKPVTAKAK